MNIEPKYEVWDKVWILKDDQIQHLTVKEIHVRVYRDLSGLKIAVKYNLDKFPTLDIPEYMLFNSKEELLGKL